MLPESLRELFALAESDDFPREEAQRHDLARLVHATLHQDMLIRTAMTKFAHKNGLNLVDFTVLATVSAGADDSATVTPSYVSEQLALSASTLTSILERLSARGLLLRGRDETDKRRIALYCTSTAAALILDFYRKLGTAYEDSLGKLTEAQVATMRESVDTLNIAHRAAADTMSQKTATTRADS